MPSLTLYYSYDNGFGKTEDLYTSVPLNFLHLLKQEVQRSIQQIICEALDITFY